MSARETRIRGNGPLEAFAAALVVVSRILMQAFLAAQDLFVGVEIIRRALRHAVGLALFQPPGYRRDDGARDLVLEGEDVDKIAIVALSPHMLAGGDADELGP